jgi:hypothetical protein
LGFLQFFVFLWFFSSVLLVFLLDKHFFWTFQILNIFKILFF